MVLLEVEAQHRSIRRNQMVDDPNLTPAGRGERAARDKRLAEALRANLRRRKEQARARKDEPAPPGDAPSRRNRPSGRVSRS